MLPKLYYISQGRTLMEHFMNIRCVLECGVRMVQLRLKELGREADELYYYEIRRLTLKYRSLLIINDMAEVAFRIGADGVHVGREDMDPEAIRTHISYHEKFIIGATANSEDEFRMRVAQNITYIGLGPYRYTITKKKLSPVLGMEGFRAILGRSSVAVPVYAVGGIGLEDVRSLMDTGCYGVAVSGDISCSKVVDREEKPAEKPSETWRNCLALKIKKYEFELYGR